MAKRRKRARNVIVAQGWKSKENIDTLCLSPVSYGPVRPFARNRRERQGLDIPLDSMPMSRLTIHQVPCLRDNYAYLLHCPETGATGALDPSEAEPVLKAAAGSGWRITHVLNTHHHWDHVGGNGGIKSATGARVIGPEPDRNRIPELDETVAEGRPFRLGNAEATIFFIPGHTKGHMAFWFPESEALFCGDTLFTLGCGRLFEGTPEQMWTSLGKLRRLPGETNVYCGHESVLHRAARLHACA